MTNDELLRCPRCQELLDSGLGEPCCPRCLLRLAAGEIGLASPAAPGRGNALRLSLSAGDCFAGYELLEEIACGGMGVVFKARQAQPRRIVALKVMVGGHIGRQELVERFRIEIEAAAHLAHPNIVPIYEAAVEEGLPYFSMAYIEGANLSAAAREHPLAAREAARFLVQAGRALQHAHDRGVLHRDLKPSNLLLDRQGRVWLTDFGLARWMSSDSELTLTGQVLGSPSYMPPEQAAGQRNRVGPASDVYSLGAVLYYLVTGRPPFLAESVAGTVQQVLQIDPPSPRLLNPEVPRDLETICLKCLAKEPARRYSSAAELAADCDRFLQSAPIQARPVSALEKGWLWCKRRPQMAAVLAGSFAVLLLAFLISASQWRRAANAQQRIAAALQESQMRLADRGLWDGDSLEGLSALARVVREDPSNGPAVTRLYDAINRRSFPTALGKPLHEDTVVWSSSLRPDGTHIATAINTSEAFVWSLVNPGAEPQRFAHPDKVYRVQFSPDGQRLATACSDTILRLWDLPGLSQPTALLRHDLEVFNFSFRPDGMEIVSVELDGTVRVWDLAKSEQRLLLCPHERSFPWQQSSVEAVRITDMRTVLYTHDGSRILSCARAPSARMWNSRTGELEQEFPHGDLVLSVDVSFDDQQILTASRDGTICLWDAHSGACSLRLAALPTVPIVAVLSPDATRVVAAFYDGTVRTWDTRGKPIGQVMPHKHYVPSIAFSADGSAILTAAFDGTARVWDAESGKPLTPALRAGATLRAGQFFQEGQHFFTRGRGGVVIWDLNASPDNRGVLEVGRPIRVTLFKSDQEFITMDDKMVGRLWRLDSPKPLTPPLPNPGQSFDLLRSDDTFPVRFAAQALLWEMATGRRLADLLRSGEKAYSFDCSSDGKCAAVGRLEGGFRVFHWSGSEPSVRDITGSAAITAIRLSPDVRHLVTASVNGVIQVWDAQTAAPVGPPLRHSNIVRGFDWTADGRCLIAWGDFHGAVLWNLAGPDAVDRLLPHDSEVICASFDRAGRRVVTASFDRTARVWDVATGKALTSAMPHANEPRRIAFTSDERRVVTAAADGVVRFWDPVSGVPSGEPLFAPSPLWGMDVSRDGRWLAAGSADGRAYFWDITPPPLPAPNWLPDLAEALAGVRLRDDLVPEPLPVTARAAVLAKVAALSDADFYVRWARNKFNEHPGFHSSNP